MDLGLSACFPSVFNNFFIAVDELIRLKRKAKGNLKDLNLRVGREINSVFS